MKRQCHDGSLNVHRVRKENTSSQRVKTVIKQTSFPRTTTTRFRCPPERHNALALNDLNKEMSARHLVAEGEGKTDPKRLKALHRNSPPNRKIRPSKRKTEQLLRVRVDGRVLKERALNSKVLGLLLRLQTVDARLKSVDGGFRVKVIVMQRAR